MHLTFFINNPGVELPLGGIIVLGGLAGLFVLLFLFPGAQKRALVAVIGALLLLIAGGGCVVQHSLNVSDRQQFTAAAHTSYGLNLTNDQARALLEQPNHTAVFQTPTGEADAYGSTFVQVQGKRTRVTLYQYEDTNRWTIGTASAALHSLPHIKA